MKTIAHLKFLYLPISETFVYEYIKNIRKFKSIVIAEETQNLDKFPVEYLFSMNRLPKFQWYFNKAQRAIIRKILKREIAPTFYKTIAQKENVSIFHAHFGENGVGIISLAKKLGIPLITSFYGTDASSKSRLERWKNEYERLFKEGNLFLAEGNAMKKKLIALGCPSEKIKILHIAVDLNKFIFNPRKLNSNEKIKILICGRFTEKKGIAYGIEAFSKVYKTNKNIELNIVGDGPLRSEFENLIRKLDIDKSVILWGYLSHNEYAELMSKCHLLMAPSVTAKDGDSEGGAPTVLLEAQASGMPILSTTHDDIPEVVSNGNSGFLVPERDINALSEKLLYLIEHPDIWEEMGKEGRKHIEENYNVKYEIPKLEEIYNSLYTF